MTFRQRACASLLLISTLVAAPAEAALVRPVATAPVANAPLMVFGYGRNTVGGAGGRVVYVTNLRDAGPGSLRAALMADFRRIVRFRVSGTITLQSRVKIRDPYITVAGHVAPGKGVQVRGAPIIVITHDVILRHLRLHPGDMGMTAAEASEADPLTLNGVGKNVYNVVLDHMSLLWGPDIGGLAILGNVHNVTVQNSIMGEGLRLSRHRDTKSMALNVTPMRAGQAAPSRITFFRNLLTTSDLRMPRVVGASCVDLVNNLIYNWGTHAASGNPRSLNMIGNWFRRGPRMINPYTWFPADASVAQKKFARSVFTRNNRHDGFAGRRRPDGTVYATYPRCGGPSVTPRPVSTVMSTVLAHAGARLPIRDTVDQRVINNVRNRIGRFFNGMDYPAPNPYWPSLTN
jgi:hypothetical protein